MNPKTWAGLCAFMAGVWHRPIGEGEQAAGLQLLAALDDADVRDAVESLAKSGREFMPSWSLVYSTAVNTRLIERWMSDPRTADGKPIDRRDQDHSADRLRLLEAPHGDDDEEASA